MQGLNDTPTEHRLTPRGKPDLWQMLAALALAIIAICAIISTITLGKISERVENLYNVTAKPHCYLSPNDPRRREIERSWGRDPTSQGSCDAETKPAD
jgi:hypothetical protein